MPFMSTATLTSKGQITIPAAVREALRVGAGDRVEFVEIAPGSRLEVAARIPEWHGGLCRPPDRALGLFGWLRPNDDF